MCTAIGLAGVSALFWNQISRAIRCEKSVVFGGGGLAVRLVERVRAISGFGSAMSVTANTGFASRVLSLRIVSTLLARTAAGYGLQQQAVSICDCEPLRDSTPASQQVGETKSISLPKSGPLPTTVGVPSTTNRSMSRNRGTAECVPHTL